MNNTRNQERKLKVGTVSLNNPSVQVLKIQVRERLFKTVRTLVNSMKTIKVTKYSCIVNNNTVGFHWFRGNGVRSNTSYS